MYLSFQAETKLGSRGCKFESCRGHLRIESLHNLQTFLFLLENQIYLSFQAETKLKIYGS